MKKKIIRVCLSVLAVSVVAAAAWLVMEFRNKSLEISDMQAQLSGEQAIKLHLAKTLLSTREEVDKLKLEVDSYQKQLAEVNNKLAVSEANNAELLREKKALVAKLHSLTELKKAIKEVKIEMKQERRRQLLAEKETRKEIDVNKLSNGNKGFLAKDGKTTYKRTVKIEVRSVN